MRPSPCKVRATFSRSFPHLKQQQICFPFKKLSVFTGPANPVSPPSLLSLPFALAHHPPVTVLSQSLRCAELFPLPEPLHLLSFCSLARSCPHLTRVTPAIPEILPSSFIPFSKLCIKHFLVLPHSWTVSPYLTCSL